MVIFQVNESPKMVTILVKEQVIFLVIVENREIPVRIIVTFFGDNIVTKYSDDFFTVNGDFPSESPKKVKKVVKEKLMF